jgi:hypothetical protein
MLHGETRRIARSLLPGCAVNLRTPDARPRTPVRGRGLARLTLRTARPEQQSTRPSGAVDSRLPKWALARRGFRQGP